MEVNRSRLSCAEAGDVITAVDRSIEALFASGGDPDEIRQVAQRLHDEAGWPQVVVTSYVEFRIAEEAELGNER